MEMSGEIGYGINSAVWTPKEKEKCDFKPDDLGTAASWVPCYVTEVKHNPNDPEQRFIQVKYKVGDSIRMASLLYPSISVKKCGSILHIRDDCNKDTNELPDLKY
jgi:hypothetical protein